jgi:hypothetical protein
MANTASYPIIVPKAGDLIVGTQTFTAADPVTDNPTRNFTVQSLVDLAVSGTYLPLAGGTLAGSLVVNGGVNITGDITMQNTTSAIYMASPDGTLYKVQMANGGTFNITAA